MKEIYHIAILFLQFSAMVRFQEFLADLHPLWQRLKPILITDFAIQWTLSVPSILFQTEKFYDLSGATTTVFLAWFSLK